MSEPPSLTRGTRRYLAARRVLELIVIAIVTPLVLLLVLVLAAAIWLDDRGPALFVQRRAGRAGRAFPMVKLRSMRDAGRGVTRLGRVLRPLHLDELPQLWNVVRGDMSLIGPRPVPVDLYGECLERIPDYDWRHLVRPGLVGKAQVALGYTSDLAGERRKWRYDVEYIHELGWRVDGQILLGTLHLPGSGLRGRRQQGPVATAAPSAERPTA